MFIRTADGGLKTLLLDWHLARWIRNIEGLDKPNEEPPVGPRQPYLDKTVRAVLTLCAQLPPLAPPVFSH
jgi:hypothetical protein